MAPKKGKTTKDVADTNGWPVALSPLKNPVPEEIKKEELIEFTEGDDGEEKAQQGKGERLEHPGDCLKACNVTFNWPETHQLVQI